MSKMITILAAIVLSSPALGDYEGLRINTTDPANTDYFVDVVIEAGVNHGIPNDEMALEGQVTDVDTDGDAESDSDSEAYSVTYEVSHDGPVPIGASVETRAASAVEGQVAVGLFNGWGHSGAHVSGSSEATVLDAVSSVSEDATLAVAEGGSLEVGGTFWIFGAQTTVLLAGSETKIQSVAGTDPTPWKQTSSAMVSTSWASAYDIEISRVTTSGTEPAHAWARADVTAYSVVTFRFTGLPKGSGDAPGGH